MRTEQSAPAATRSHGARVQAPADPAASDGGARYRRCPKNRSPEVALAPHLKVPGANATSGLPSLPSPRAAPALRALRHVFIGRDRSEKFICRCRFGPLLLA